MKISMEDKHKFPRTYHFEWSPGLQSDDKVITDLSGLLGEEVVATIKMDGENSSLYSDYTHARSLDSRHNFTRDWLKKMHAVLKHQIPDNFILVGENLWAEHAIRYPDGYLQGYFYLFSIWENGDTCLSYDDIVMYADLFDLPMPREVIRGVFNEDFEKKLKVAASMLNTTLEEGFVVRVTRSFKREDYSRCVAKYVRKGHVQPNAEHWLKNARQNGSLPMTVKPFFMG